MTQSEATTASKPRTATRPVKRSTKTDKPGRPSVEIKIGVQNTPREIVLDVDQDADEIAKALTAATAENSTFMLADTKGRRILVPADKIAYIEIGEPEQRRVGFGAV